MLSPKNHQVPLEFAANLDHRRSLANKMSRREQSVVRKACRDDILFWINSFVMTYAPKRPGRKVVPFTTWPVQDRCIRKILDHVDQQKDLVGEKSRDMGLSWICVIVLDWLQRFHEDIQGILVSRQEELVDSSSPDSLFWKIDFLGRYIPDWLQPKFKRKSLFRENQENGSVLIGYATTAKTGIGGRATVMLIDEFSRIQQDTEILEGTADTCDCRLFISTHVGPGTAFHRLCTNGITDKMVVHWTEHPEKARGAYRYDAGKNAIVVLDKSYEFPADYRFVMEEMPAGGPKPGVRSPWYDRECLRRASKRAIAMDLDIDVAGTTEQFFDPVHTLFLKRSYVRPPSWEGEVAYERDTGAFKGFVPVPGGPLKLWTPLINGKPKPMDISIGADLSQGTGATPTCLSGCDRQTGEKVLEYLNPTVDPKAMAPIAFAIGTAFCDHSGRPAFMIWEQQGPGVPFGGKLLELGYSHVYFEGDELPFTTGGNTSKKPGWIPSDPKTLIILTDYREALAMGYYLNHSEAAMEELKQFRYNERGFVEHSLRSVAGSPSGAGASHGDITIADALSWKGAKDVYRPPQKKAKEEPPLLSLAWRIKMDERRRSLEPA